MNCQSLYSMTNKKNIINLLSADLAQRAVKVKQVYLGMLTCLKTEE